MVVEGLESAQRTRSVVWAAAPERGPSAYRLAVRVLQRSIMELMVAVVVVALAICVPVLSAVLVCLGDDPCVPLWLPP